GGTRTGESAASAGGDLPVVAVRVQRELQHANRRVVATLGVGESRVLEPVQTFAATRADGDLANPEGRVCRAIGPHWFEALIVVIVTIQHEVGTAVVQRLPERCRLGADEGAIGCAAELRMMHQSQGTR